MVWTLTKDWYFWTTYQPRLVNVVCEQPLTLVLDNSWLDLGGYNWCGHCRNGIAHRLWDWTLHHVDESALPSHGIQLETKSLYLSPAMQYSYAKKIFGPPQSCNFTKLKNNETKPAHKCMFGLAQRRIFFFLNETILAQILELVCCKKQQKKFLTNNLFAE